MIVGCIEPEWDCLKEGKAYPGWILLLVISEHLGIAVSELLEGLKH